MQKITLKGGFELAGPCLLKADVLLTRPMVFCVKITIIILSNILIERTCEDSNCFKVTEGGKRERRARS